MKDALVKMTVAKPRLAKRPSTSIPSTTYRVSKAQSLRLRAFDKRAEAAEAKKLKAAEAREAKANKKTEDATSPDQGNVTERTLRPAATGGPGLA